MLAVAGVAVGLSALFYRRAFDALSRRQRWVLLSLRVVAVLLVVVLLFRPVFSHHKQHDRPPGVVMLVDTSESMSIADDASGVTRLNQAVARVEDWHGRLENNFDIRLFRFAQRAEQIDDPTQLGQLAPDGKATSLSAALEAAAATTAKMNAEAVILLTDGIHNSAGDPLAPLTNLTAAVHTVGVGTTLSDEDAGRDVQVAGIDCPPRMIVDNIARITASVEGIGLGGRVIKLALDEDDVQIAETELAIDAAEGYQTVDFDFQPTKAGRHSYTVRAVPVDGERIEENNRRTATSLVVEPGIRVLYVEGTLRAEYGALVDRFLAKDPDLEFRALVQTRPNKFLVRSNMSELPPAAIPADKESIDKFHVFIFGDLDASYIKPEQQKLYADRVRAGAGLIMLGGYHSLGPGGYEGTPLGEILPVLTGGRDIGQIEEQFLPTLTPDGLHHPIFANIGGFFPTLQREAPIPSLPPLNGCTRVAGARPGATVLAVLPEANNEMPLLSVWPVDEGRSAAFCGDTTRRWQQGPRALGQDSPFLRFWGQTVRWLAGRAMDIEGGAGIKAETDKLHYRPGEPIRISAVVRDQEGEASSKAVVKAKVRFGPTDSTSVNLSPQPGPPGNYAAEFEPEESGTYSIDVEATIGEYPLAAERINVQVGHPDMEFERLGLEERTLERIAARSGGRYLHITTADSLIEQLDAKRKKQRVTTQRPLYWPPGFWLLFALVLSGEWVLRRRFQLP